MASSRKRRQASHDDPPPRRVRRTMRRLMMLLVLLLIAVAAAPTIVSNTSLRDTLLGLGMPAGEWRIESREAALGWSGTQTLTGVSIVDADNKPLFSAETITMERSLLDLALDQNNLGQIKIDRPVVHVTTRAEGSNVEDLLSAWGANVPAGADQPNDSTESSNSPIALVVEIVDGLVHGQDAPTGGSWALSGANLTFRLGDSTETGAELSGVAQLIESPSSGGATLPEAGRLKFQLKQTAQKRQQLAILADQLPLRPLQPWIARALEGGHLAGTISADARIEFYQHPERGLLLKTGGKIEASQLRFTARMLQGDVLACDSLAIPWNLACDEERIHIESLALDSPWAKMQMAGKLSYDELADLGLRRLPKHASEVSGTLDLAQLAAMLPRTLQLREGVRIDSGEMRIQAQATRGEQGFRWTGQVAARNVVGADGRRSIRWKQPIEATARWVESPLGGRLEQLALNAPFANAQFQTSGDQVDGQFDFDLEKLSAQVGQFVDLSAWQVRGGGTGSLQIRQARENRFQGVAELDLNGVHVVQHSKPLWIEPQLKVHLTTEGQQADLAPISLAAATMKLRGARDNFDAKLLEPVDLRNAQQAWKIQLRGMGPLESWAGRLRPWVAGIPTDIRGEANLEANLAVAPDVVQLSGLKANVSQLHVHDGELVIDEPRTELSGDCRWDAKSGRLVSQRLQFVSSTMALLAGDLSVALSSGGVPEARGSVAVRANLERLAAALGQVNQPDSTWARGSAEGNVTLSSKANQLRAEFSLTANQMQLVRSAPTGGASYGQPEVLWSEPQLKTTGKVIYGLAEDRLQLEDFQAIGQTVQLSTLATVEKLQTVGAVNGGGSVRYDPAALTALLAAYLGPEVFVEGNQEITFQVAGNLVDPPSTTDNLHWSHRLRGSAGAGWNSASAYGMSLGPGHLQGEVRAGQVQIAPLDVAVGQGRLQISPLVMLEPGPQQIQLARGPLLTNVEVSPRVTENLLKYVAPVLAGATRAEGLFSVDLDGAQIPFASPQHAKVGGRMMVHRLRITPGPMTKDLVALVRQVEALTKRKEFLQTARSSGTRDALTIENRQVDFQVAQGRVYHRNLEFMVDGVPVRSYGSVGFDQTLSLMLEIPIQDKWIEREKALSSLAGQSLQIPIRGTFQRPQIDQRAVADLSGKLLQGVATDAIGGEINRQLEKLFRSR